MLRTLRYCAMLLLLLLAPPSQTQDECAVSIANLPELLRGTCQELAPGTLCYVHPESRAILSNAARWDTPDQRVPWESVQVVETRAYDPASGDWGLSLLRLPDDMAGSLLLAGAAWLENRSSDEAPFALHLQTSFSEQPGCGAAPSAALLYGTADATFTLHLNSAMINFNAATVILYQQSKNSFVVSVIHGTLDIADGPGAGRGQTLIAITENDGTIAFWSTPRPVNEQEIALLQALAPPFAALTAVNVAGGCLVEQVHVVVPGDNAFRISQTYGVSLAALVALNNIGDDYVIYPGQELRIPCDENAPLFPSTAAQTTCESRSTHIVQPGENLFRIAQRYGVTVDDIVAANNLPDRGQIYVNQELIIPCGVDSGLSSVAPSADAPAEDAPAEEDAPPDEAAAPAQEANPNTEEIPPEFCTMPNLVPGGIPADLQNLIDTLCKP